MNKYNDNEILICLKINTQFIVKLLVVSWHVDEPEISKYQNKLFITFNLCTKNINIAFQRFKKFCM